MTHSLAPAGRGGSPADGEEQFRALTDSAPVMIRRSGPDKLCDFFNRRWLDFTGRTLDQEAGDGWAGGVHPDDVDRCLQAIGEAFDARREFSLDYRLRRFDGVYRWIMDNGCPYIGPDGSFAGYLGTCTDITERKETEESLRNALQDKQALLQEVNHRVKNNMQLILSLLRLQAKRVDAPELRRQLEESAARVHSVALVQAQAYQSDTLTDVDLGDYLRNLVSSLKTSYGRDGIGIALDVGQVPVSIHRAVPLGLVANELIVNAFRHAFPEGRQGQVAIVAECSGGKARLVIADDGIGMPAGSYPRQGALGFQLIAGLAGQAGATVQAETGAGGTRFTVEFPSG